MKLFPLMLEQSMKLFPLMLEEKHETLPVDVGRKHETLPVDVGRKLAPIFRRLSEESLLERCKRNMTRNPNESLHSVIWKYCPKIVYFGRKSIESATNMAICQSSLGATFREA